MHSGSAGVRSRRPAAVLEISAQSNGLSRELKSSVTASCMVLVATLALRGQGGQQRLPRQAQPVTAAVQGVIRTETGLGLSGARVVLRNQTTGNQVERTTPGDGVFLLP